MIVKLSTHSKGVLVGFRWCNLQVIAVWIAGKRWWNMPDHTEAGSRFSWLVVSVFAFFYIVHPGIFWDDDLQSSS